MKPGDEGGYGKDGDEDGTIDDDFDDLEDNHEKMDPDNKLDRNTNLPSREMKNEDRQVSGQLGDSYMHYVDAEARILINIFPFLKKRDS
jgi:hypothetical protein